MKNIQTILLRLMVLILAGLSTLACTERQCYREHLKVFTADYVAVCEGGYWTDFDAASYNYVGFEIDAHARVSEQCPVVQCIKRDCKCTEGYTREQIGVMQVGDLLDKVIDSAM